MQPNSRVQVTVIIKML